jgi:DNA repair protein RadC
MDRESGVLMHDVEESERPRERLFELGPGALSDADLVALVFGSGSGGEGVLDVAARVTRSIHLRRLHQTAVEDLLAIKGMGPARAAQLLAAAEIGRRLWPDADPIPLVRGPETIFELTADIRRSNREHFVGFYLNSRNQVLRREIISIGSLNASIVHPREVFIPIRRRARKIWPSRGASPNRGASSGSSSSTMSSWRGTRTRASRSGGSSDEDPLDRLGFHTGPRGVCRLPSPG